MLALMCTRIKSNLSDHRSRRGAPSAYPHPAETALDAIVSIQNFILIKRRASISAPAYFRTFSINSTVPELVEKEDWYHGNAPADGGEMRAL
jgi:hypothetical protein